jgi:HAD superfamily hydrolase (TIGR01484 family)
MKSVKLIATDLDGTLFYPKKRSHMVTKENRAFIHRFVGDGGRILLVTGRNAFFGEKVGSKIGINFDYIACNGSLVVSGGKTIFEKGIANEEAKKIIEVLQNIHEAKLIFLFTKDHNMVCQRKEIAKWVKMGYSIYRIFEGTYREPYFKDDAIFQQELEQGTIYKILMFPGFGKKSIPFSFELAKKLQPLYPDLNIVASEQAIEITAQGCTKREGISFYLDYNQINVDNV